MVYILENNCLTPVGMKIELL